MERLPVDSSTIVDIGYDSSSMTLEIGFKQGSIYQYFDVPDAVYQELMRADSKGKFFHVNIRDHFRYTKL